VNEETFTTIVDNVAKGLDAFGVVVIVAGSIFASAVFGRAVIGRQAGDDAYRQYRQRVGRSILLGLEFLVAADIIRTIAVAPTFRGVGVLAIIVLVRTFLSFTLEVELEGRWPWQKHHRTNDAKPASQPGAA
jgi:uncharacterized membrane protein